MNVVWGCGLLLLSGSAMATPATPAPKENAIELTMFGGYARMVSKIERTRDASAFNGGSAIAFGAVYRSRYFLSPFIDVGYYPLYASRFVADVGSGGGSAHAASSLGAYGFMAGPAVDFWRLRVKYGIGVFNVHVRTTVLGATTVPDEIDFGYTFALSGFFLRTPRVQIGGEGRAGIIVEADKAFVSLGLTIAGKAIAW